MPFSLPIVSLKASASSILFSWVAPVQQYQYFNSVTSPEAVSVFAVSVFAVSAAVSAFATASAVTSVLAVLSAAVLPQPDNAPAIMLAAINVLSNCAFFFIFSSFLRRFYVDKRLLVRRSPAGSI